MSELITDEMVETAARAEWDHYKPDLDGGPWEGLTEAQRASWREGVEVVLAAAIPLVAPAIKAEALRAVAAMHRPEPQEVNTVAGPAWIVFCRACGLEWGDDGCPTVTTILEALRDA